MSHRQEEKERRRQERMAAEQAAAARSARKRRLQMVGGGILAAAAVAGVAIAIAAGGGGDDGGGDVQAPEGVELPQQKIRDLNAAAEAAGCTPKDYESEGRNHTSDRVTYKTNPPNSGDHDPTWAEDGVYAPGNVPTLEKLVHALEHGRVIIWYRVGLPQAQIDELEAAAAENEGYKVLVVPKQKMPFQVALSAWTHVTGCERMSDDVIDVIRNFRQRYTDKGPEFVN